VIVTEPASVAGNEAIASPVDVCEMAIDRLSVCTRYASTANGDPGCVCTENHDPSVELDPSVAHSS